MTVSAVAYFRTSSSTNVGEDKDSLKRQREAVVAYAKAKKIKIVKEFYDAAVSGADQIDQRGGFLDLLAYIRGNGAKTILVESASRFARDIAVQIAGHELLKAEQFELIPVDAPDHFINETPTAEMVRNLLAVVSQFEKKSLVEKLQKARDRKAIINKDKGITTLSGDGKCGGRKSYREMDSELVALAKQLHRKNRQSHKRLPLRKIAAILFEKGYGTSTGKPFGAAQIKSMVA